MVDGVAPGEALPDLTFMVFQGMFFIITPALICGAFAERMKFSSMVIFMVALGNVGLLSALPLGLGGGILAYGEPSGVGRRGVGFRRRHGGAHQLGFLRAGVCLS